MSIFTYYTNSLTNTIGKNIKHLISYEQTKNIHNPDVQARLIKFTLSTQSITAVMIFNN